MNLFKIAHLIAFLTLTVQSQGLWDSFDENPDSIITSIPEVPSPEEPKEPTEVSNETVDLASPEEPEETTEVSNEIADLASPEEPKEPIEVSNEIVDVASPEEPKETTEVLNETVNLASPEELEEPKEAAEELDEEVDFVSQEEPTEKIKENREVEIPQNFPPEKMGARETQIPPAPKPEAKAFKLHSDKPEKKQENPKEEIKSSAFKVPFDRKPIVQNRTSVTLVPLYEKKQGEYVSPKVVGFSSLVLPGLGQFRVPNNNLSGAAYLLSEVAIGFSLWYFGFEKQQQSIDNYKSLEQNYFSKSSYEDWSNDLRIEANNQSKASEFNDNYDATRGTWCRSIYGDEEQFVSDCTSRSTSHSQKILSDRLDVSNKEAYYKLIGANQWVSGWSDAKLKDHKDVIRSGNYNSLGTSEYQSDFNSSREDAEFYASMKTWLITALVANHIISAIDAAYSAEKNNEQLYKETPIKTSFRIDANGEYHVAFNWSLSW